MLRVRFGLWHNRAIVYFKDRMDAPLSIELDRGLNRIIVLPGQYLTVRHDADAEETMDFPWRLSDEECDWTEFARCALHDVYLSEIGHNTWESHDLLPNHELPWPNARDCWSYDLAEELMRECVMRRSSADAAGVRPATPPPLIQTKLTREMRLKLFGGNV